MSCPHTRMPLGKVITLARTLSHLARELTAIDPDRARDSRVVTRTCRRAGCAALMMCRFTVPVTQPEAHQMPPLFRFGKILERGAVVQQPVVAGEEHLARLEQQLHVEVLAA